jgi:hypothetical protein
MCASSRRHCCSAFRNGSSSKRGQGDDGRAVQEAEVEDDDQPVDVEEGEHGYQRSQFGPFDRSGLHEIRNEIAMSEHHPLRKARRPRRVGQCHHIRLRIDGHRGWIGVACDRGKRSESRGLIRRDQLDCAPRLFNGRMRLVRKRPGGNEHPRTGICQLVRQLVRGVCRVRGSQRCSEPRHCVKRDRKFRRVRRAQRNDVAFAHSEIRQPRGQAPDLLSKLSIGDDTIGDAVDERRVLR